MKIVLDANIFISSFFWGGNPGIIIDRVIERQDTLYISQEILREIENVLNRPKFHVSNDEINYFMRFIERAGNKVVSKKQIKNGSRDKNDNKYIECGIAANVDYIISGDIHLLELKEYANIKIVTAKNYLDIVNMYTN